jgi:uncharacterized membrane protein
MLRSFLIGLVAGSRALTPLAAVSEAARRGALPADRGGPAWLGHPAAAAGLKLLAAGELLGDKLDSAPDRIVPAGVLARIATGGLAGAALAPRRYALAGAALGALAAVGAAYLTFKARKAAMARFGQKATGLVEDALTVGAAGLVLKAGDRAPAQRRVFRLPDFRHGVTLH